MRGSTSPLQMLRISSSASSRLALIARASRWRVSKGAALSDRTAVEAQRGERDQLGGAVMQVGADAPEIALIEGGGALCCPANPHLQGPVLLEQGGKLRHPLAQRPALGIDGAAAAQHDRR